MLSILQVFTLAYRAQQRKGATSARDIQLEIMNAGENHSCLKLNPDSHLTLLFTSRLMEWQDQGRASEAREMVEFRFPGKTKPPGVF